MNSASWENVVKVSILGLGGTTGGAAITAQLVSSDAGWQFWRLGAAWLAVSLIGLILLLRYSRKRAIAHLFFTALGINVGGTTMMLGLCLPLFWMHGVFSLVGSILIGYFAVVLAYQIRRAHSDFLARWEQNHEKALAQCCNSSSKTILVGPLLQQLQIHAELYLPRRLQFLGGIVSLGLILSMIIGLNLRKVYPEFSAFAWGVPALTLTTILVQMSFLQFLLSMKIAEMEKNSGAKFSPMNADEIARLKTGRRKKKSR